MSTAGSKDLIPNQVLVSYIAPGSIANAEPRSPEAKASKPSTKENPEESSSPNGNRHVMGHKIANGKVTAANKKTLNTSSRLAKPTAATHLHTKRGHLTAGNDKKTQPGMVTVVFRDPGGVLVADISLEHR
jgi:hypothetical protein